LLRDAAKPRLAGFADGGGDVSPCNKLLRVLRTALRFARLPMSVAGFQAATPR